MDMGLGEDLSRLAELKESGVLTQQEFDRQKKRLLNDGKSGPSKLMQFTAGLVAFMIIGSFVYKGVEKLAETAAEDDLLCDSPEVRETAVNVLNQQVAEAKNQLGILGGLIPSGAQIHGISSATELYRDKESGFIACLAMARNEKGEGRVAYTVSWQDRAIGKFWVELANPDELAKQYGRTEQQEPSPAPELIPTPEQASQEVAREMAEPVIPAQETVPEVGSQTATAEIAPEAAAEDEAPAQEQEQPAIEEQEPKPIPKVAGRRAAYIQSEQYGEISLYDSNAQRCIVGSRNAVTSGSSIAGPSRGCWSESDGVVRVTFHGPATGTLRFREEEFTRDPTYDQRGN
jgi:Short C-terminal domain